MTKMDAGSEPDSMGSASSLARPTRRTAPFQPFSHLRGRQQSNKDTFAYDDAGRLVAATGPEGPLT